MKKKVLFISPGPLRKISNQSKYVVLSDHFHGDIITSSNKEEILRRRNIGKFTLNCIKFSYNYALVFNLKFFLYCIYFAVQHRVRGNKYDLVVTYDPLKTGVFGAISAKILKAKFAPEVNGVYTSPAEYLDNGKSCTVKLRKKMYPLIEAWVLKKADGIKLLFPTQIEQFGKIVEDKIIYSFPNFIDIDRFTNLGITEKQEVLFVGYPFKRKGVDILIDAFKIVSPKFPKWRLKILGWFPNKDELMAHIGNHSKIYHHPPVYYSDMPQHIGSCAVLVLPSRSEAMGRILVEAMAARKPRIGSNVDGIPTVINDGVDGLLFEPENIEDLANKLDLLMGNPELRLKLGKAGEKRARKEFAEEVYIRNIVSFYHEVLDS